MPTGTGVPRGVARTVVAGAAARMRDERAIITHAARRHQDRRF
ncbi:hypothetical protein BURMUCGD1_1556 [Burkholderia multivorans CGD1]|jgi:hypothetical protein|nr:hypothetical protein BURMUCGD1_1556 [Burkholderia multivorans CGD1]